MEICLGIRVAVDDDVLAIVGSSAALFSEDAGTRDAFTNTNWPMEEGEGCFAGLIGSELDFCLVAEASGEVIGYLAARIGSKTTVRPVEVAELESIYVRKTYRSSGVGEELVGEFLKLSGIRGSQRASVTAYSSNERAISFYEKLGFSPKSLSMERRIK